MTKAQPLQSRTETVNVSVNVLVIDYYPRCIDCHKVLLGMATRPWRQICRICKTINHGESETR